MILCILGAAARHETNRYFTFRSRSFVSFFKHAEKFQSQRLYLRRPNLMKN